MIVRDDVRAILADAYREAALAGTEMRRATEAFETVRSALAGEPTPYRAWERLDDAVAGAEDDALGAVLRALRAKFTERTCDEEAKRVRGAAAGGRDDGWRELVSRVALSLVHFRVRPAIRILSDAPRLGTERDVRIASMLSVVREHVARQRWANAFDLFEALASEETIPGGVRAQLHVIVAAIQTHYFEKTTLAQRELERGFALAPDEPRLYVGRAQVLSRMGRMSDAERDLERALELAPGSEVALCDLGDLAAQRGDRAEAAERYDAALRARPGDIQAYRSLIRLYGDRSMFEQMRGQIVALAEKAILVEPDFAADVAVEAADTFANNGDAESARKWLDRADAIDPANPRLLAVRATLLLRTGASHDECARLYRAALELDADTFEACQGLAFLAEQRKAWDEADGWLDRGARIHRHWDVVVTSSRAVVARRRGELEAARELLRTAIAAEPWRAATVGAVEDLARQCGERDGIDAARKVLDEILTIRPDYTADYHGQLGKLLFDQGDYRAASDHYAQAIAARPSAPLHRSCAAVARELGEWDRAYEHLDAAEELGGDPDEQRRQRMLTENARGNQEYRRGAYALAAEHYGAAIELVPGDHVLHSNLGGALELSSDDRLEEAARAFEEAAKLSGEREPLRRAEAVRRRIELAALYGGRAARRVRPLQPITLEIAPDLVPSFARADDLLPEVTTLLAEARRRMLAEVGVRMPGVNVRSVESLPTNLCLVRLREVVVSAKAIEGSAGVAHEAFAHVYETVRTLASLLFGHDEALERLRDAGLAARLRDAGDRALTELTLVLRALLAEQVPIVALSEIVDVFLGAWKPGAPLTPIVSAIRLHPAIRPKLPGNAPDAVWFQVGDDLAASFLAASVAGAAEPMVALSLADAAGLVVELQRGFQGAAPPVTLVVDDPRVRPLLACFALGYLRGVTVLSHAERQGIDVAAPRGVLTRPAAEMQP